MKEIDLEKRKKKQGDILKIEYFPETDTKKITYRGGKIKEEKIQYPIEIFDKVGNLIYRLNKD